MIRRILFIVSILLVTLPLRAQYSSEYYHRVGDTIEWRSEIGYYAWWQFEYYFENNLFLIKHSCDRYSTMINTPYWQDSAVVLMRFYTPTPLRVVGLAGGGLQHHFGDGPWNLNIDTNGYKNYYVIYDAMPDSFPLVGKLKWNPFDPHRTLHVRNHTGAAMPEDSTCCKFSPNHSYFPIYEYYFDSVVTVTDSFYVGGTFFGDLVVDDLITIYYGVHSTGPYGVPPCRELDWETLPDHCSINPWLYKVKNANSYSGVSFVEAPWEWAVEKHDHFLIYPLIEVDTTVPPTTLCDSVANVQVTPSGTTATVTWDDFPYYSRVLLRYGIDNAPQSQWTEIDVTGSTHYYLEGLQPEMRYGVTMKAECDTSKKVTPWSPPVYFWTGADTTGGGTERIEGGTLLSRLTFLRPNPARDEVQVSSSFGLTGIEIWGTDGVLVYLNTAAGHEATVDVSYLHAGTYIVAVHTLNGTTHKRLVIAR